MAGHHPDRDEPLAQRDFAVLEDRADLDGEPLAAIAALVRPVVGEVVNLGAAAMRTVSAVLPADGAEVVDADLFIAEHFHHLHQAVELLDHGFIPLDEANLLHFQACVKHVYKYHN